MNMNDMPPWLIVLLLAPILITQSIYLFTDARKRGHMRWFWGIWGIISFPLPLIIYLLWSRKWSPSQRQNQRLQ